jgi:RNA polymerase sigma-70 factor (ECF subfamily)
MTGVVRHRMEPSQTVERERATTEEAALLSRVGSGDRGEPLAELYRRYVRRVYGLGLYLLRDPSLAEDLVQDTFVRLWRSSHRFDPERATARTFIFMLARRAAVDLMRRRSARPPATAGLSEQEPADGADAFDQVIVSLDVRDALNALQPKHREILELHYLDDMTQSQIAVQLDIPLGTVKTRSFHALRALREELDRRGLV